MGWIIVGTVSLVWFLIWATDRWKYKRWYKCPECSSPNMYTQFKANNQSYIECRDCNHMFIVDGKISEQIEKYNKAAADTNGPGSVYRNY